MPKVQWLGDACTDACNKWVAEGWSPNYIEYAKCLAACAAQVVTQPPGGGGVPSMPQEIPPVAPPPKEEPPVAPPPKEEPPVSPPPTEPPPLPPPPTPISPPTCTADQVLVNEQCVPKTSITKPAEEDKGLPWGWIIGGVAVVGGLAWLAMKSGGAAASGVAGNPRGDEPYRLSVGSSYGAPMGRRSDQPSEFVGKANLQRVPFVDGDYDPGGAYWGGGRGTQPLFAAWDEEGHEIYLRASSRGEAKAKLEAQGIKFKR